MDVKPHMLPQGHQNGTCDYCGREKDILYDVELPDGLSVLCRKDMLHHIDMPRKAKSSRNGRPQPQASDKK